MKKMNTLMGVAAFGLSACVEATSTGGAAPDQFIGEVPESILEIAGPNQDLTALQVDPVDGCYTFRHIGPVETTMLPLRAKNGRPICTRVEAKAST